MTQRQKSLILLFGDLALFVASLLAMTYATKHGKLDMGFLLVHIKAFAVLFPVWIISFYTEGLYSLKSLKREGLIISLIRVTVTNIILSYLYFYLVRPFAITPRFNMMVIFAFVMFFCFYWRKFFLFLLSHEALSLKTILVGQDAAVTDLKDELEARPHLGHKIIETRTKASLQNLPKDFDVLGLDRTFLSNQELKNECINLISRGRRLIDMSELAEHATGKIPVWSIDESWFIGISQLEKRRLNNVLKFFLDRFTALFLGLITLVIFIFLFPILYLTQGRPFFYSQIRTGLRGKPFRIYKLRSMSLEAEKNGARWSTKGDLRITKMGNILRKSRLDELPQLWNILKGEMSLVGPRPERPEMIASELEGHIPFYSLRHLVAPGVTGWAQVSFRYGSSQEDSLTKLQYDLYYVKNQSIWLDLKIILKTIKSVLTGAGQ